MSLCPCVQVSKCLCAHVSMCPLLLQFFFLSLSPDFKTPLSVSLDILMLHSDLASREEEEMEEEEKEEEEKEEDEEEKEEEEGDL